MNYIVEMIIRPSRNLYQEKDLGEKVFIFAGQEFKRTDFNNQIVNKFGNKISTSLWTPLEISSKELASTPCIIYCHGNAGNKIDIIEIFDFLRWDFNICSFDFSGAGYSEGDFVTLGFNEKYDVGAVVDYLRKELGIQKIILWGRSMGAVSSLMYAELDHSLKAVVLDSPFSDFPILCEEIMANKFFMPGVISRFLISMAKERISEKIPNFDIDTFIPLLAAKKISTPCIIIHGKSDSLVELHHSRDIFQVIPEKNIKRLIEATGEHNDSRSNENINTIRDFIMQFGYDPLILRDHKRRLILRNLHFNHLIKHGINLNAVINNFQSSMQDKINKEKEKILTRKLNNMKMLEAKKKGTGDQAVIRSKSNDNIRVIDEKTNIIISKKDIKKFNSKAKKKNQKLKVSNKDLLRPEFALASVSAAVKAEPNLMNIKRKESPKRGSRPNDRQERHDRQSKYDATYDIIHEKSTVEMSHSNSPNRRLRSERTSFFGDILGCDLSLTKKDIKISKVDKTSFRRSSATKPDDLFTSSCEDSNISLLTDNDKFNLITIDTNANALEEKNIAILRDKDPSSTSAQVSNTLKILDKLSNDKRESKEINLSILENKPSIFEIQTTNSNKNCIALNSDIYIKQKKSEAEAK